VEDLVISWSMRDAQFVLPVYQVHPVRVHHRVRVHRVRVHQVLHRVQVLRVHPVRARVHRVQAHPVRARVHRVQAQSVLVHRQVHPHQVHPRRVIPRQVRAQVPAASLVTSYHGGRTQFLILKQTLLKEE
jgi:hypothetical protein